MSDRRITNVDVESIYGLPVALAINSFVLLGHSEKVARLAIQDALESGQLILGPGLRLWPNN